MQRLIRWLGMEANPVSLKEKLISTLGAFAGIALTALISLQVVGLHDGMLIIGSMGASSVLLFAVPHGQLSQPWPAFVGQIVSATVGVTCAALISNTLLAAAMAVSLAILAMHLTRSLHPPGGATALIAVIGGAKVHALGYGYVIAPVLLNAVSILVIALVVNNLLGWRRYPAILTKASEPDVGSSAGGVDVADIEHAIRQMDSTIDVTEEELMRIFLAAYQHRKNSSTADK